MRTFFQVIVPSEEGDYEEAFDPSEVVRLSRIPGKTWVTIHLRDGTKYEVFVSPVNTYQPSEVVSVVAHRLGVEVRNLFDVGSSET